MRKKKTLSALQPLAIGDPTEVHCPQVCLCVDVCEIKMCQGHCAVGVYLNRRLYIKVNILIASIAVVCGVELCFGSLSVHARVLYVGEFVRRMCDRVPLTLHKRENMRVFLLRKKTKTKKRCLP